MEKLINDEMDLFNYEALLNDLKVSEPKKNDEFIFANKEEIERYNIASSRIRTVMKEIETGEMFLDYQLSEQAKQSGDFEIFTPKKDEMTNLLVDRGLDIIYTLEFYAYIGIISYSAIKYKEMKSGYYMRYQEHEDIAQSIYDKVMSMVENDEVHIHKFTKEETRPSEFENWDDAHRYFYRQASNVVSQYTNDNLSTLTRGSLDTPEFEAFLLNMKETVAQDKHDRKEKQKYRVMLAMKYLDKEKAIWLLEIAKKKSAKQALTSTERGRLKIITDYLTEAKEIGLIKNGEIEGLHTGEEEEGF